MPDKADFCALAALSETSQRVQPKTDRASTATPGDAWQDTAAIRSSCILGTAPSRASTQTRVPYPAPFQQITGRSRFPTPDPVGRQNSSLTLAGRIGPERSAAVARVQVLRLVARSAVSAGSCASGTDRRLLLGGQRKAHASAVSPCRGRKTCVGWARPDRPVARPAGGSTISPDRYCLMGHDKHGWDFSARQTHCGQRNR